MIARRLTRAAAAARGDSRPTVPEAVEQAVRRRSRRPPADRFATAAEFARALRRAPRTAPLPAPTRRPVAAALRRAPQSLRRGPLGRHSRWLGFLLGLGVLFGWLRKHNGGGDDGGRRRLKRLAVLPFENLGRPEDEYFADGITDEVRGKLAALPGLQVTASRQLGAVQEDHQDAPADRPGAGRAVHPGRARCAGRRAPADRAGCG